MTFTRHLSSSLLLLLAAPTMALAQNDNKLSNDLGAEKTYTVFINNKDDAPCQAVLDDDLPTVRIAWSGTCNNGKAAGTGELSWDQDAAHYSGEMQDGRFTGQGTLHDGSQTWTGHWQQGKFSGEGTLVDEEAACQFKGIFSDRFSLNGEVACLDRHRVYQGTTRYFRQHGFGVLTITSDAEHAVEKKAVEALHGTWHGNTYVAKGWWENGELRFHCETAAACQKMVAADNAHQSKLLSARKGVQAVPYLIVDEDGGGKVLLKDMPYRWQTRHEILIKSGVSGKDGRMYVQPYQGETQYLLQIPGHDFYIDVAPECWKRLPEQFQGCSLMTNGPDENSESLAAKEEQRAKDAAEARIRNDALEAYRKAAASNDDELAWLGPLPAERNDKAMSDNMMALGEEIRTQLGEVVMHPPELASFTCKTPEQYGDTPDQQAVVDYLAHDMSYEYWNALLQAGKKGNWMAYFQIYRKLNNRLMLQEGKIDYVGEYRSYQLYQWLIKHKIGSIYAEIADEMGESGGGGNAARDNPLLIYAAFQGSYSTMDRVGASLMKSDQADEQKIGESMVECAHRVMPAVFDNH